MKKYVNGMYIELDKEEIEQMNNERMLPYEEAVNLKIRERYTESQEFAILRQRDEKTDEFKAYYEYCEQCKTALKTQLFKDYKKVG